MMECVVLFSVTGRRRASAQPGSPQRRKIPDGGVYGIASRLEQPAYDEGFDALHYLSLTGDGGFDVEEWRDT
ncbi:MAG: hypothetical protein ACOCYT_03105 [Chloroflexota bacterium]